MALRSLCIVVAVSACLPGSVALAQASKPPITLDEYLNTTSIVAAKLSPDGKAAVIATETPDWKNNNYRHDLWAWTAASGLRSLTHSGSEENPQWSPDGKWIAFVSDRSLPGEDTDDEGQPASSADKTSRVWLIPVSGGEALPLYTEKLEVHSYAWSADGTSICFSVTTPLTPEQQDDQKGQWKDVIRWREQDRGDVLLKLNVAAAIDRALSIPPPEKPSDQNRSKSRNKEKEKPAELPPGAETIARSTLSIGEVAPSPDGKTVAFVTEPVHKRMETPQSYEIFLVGAEGGEVRQITHNNAIESSLQWSPDGHWLHFMVVAGFGSLDAKYRDVQGRLYRMDPKNDNVERLGGSFDGSFDQYALLRDGRELAIGTKRTERRLYLIDGNSTNDLPGPAGSFTGLCSAQKSDALLFRHSAINMPEQAFLARDPLHPDQLTAITAFNPIFTQRAQIEWQAYTWKADDGAEVEGMLLFPPGKKNARHLRMLTLIHGGPADIDGNYFGADWYDWATLAASSGWLVFRPNYRGSVGYGDEFMLQISPHIVSKPGRDVLSGVDALVKDGYADPDHLAIGGYSYGGYLTNWLITQTTRFRSAISGAGAVEHAANWGNDDGTFDDAWFLGGQPWENPETYQSEAALFRFDKVKTPTHVVQGDADVRVSYLEGVTLERALEQLEIPHTFLVFPGEDHGLSKNPWHGYIKLREELKWLEKYDGKQGN
jgi:dipeptidyl aminopeptidase/acylaminoacyl peptidase